MKEKGLYFFKVITRLLILTLVFSHPVFSSETKLDLFASAGTFAELGKYFDAIKSAEKIPDSQLVPQERQLKYLSVGIWYYQLHRYSEAKKNLLKSKEFGALYEAYVYFYLGKIESEQGQKEVAEKNFEKVLQLKPQRDLDLDTRLSLQKIYVDLGQEKDSYKMLRKLERSLRGTDQHPLIIWNLIGSLLKQKKSIKACYWARKMYSRYPSHPLTYDWKVNLRLSKYKNQTLFCSATYKDIEKRMSVLQWSGEAARSLREIREVKSESLLSDSYLADELLAKYYIQQGFIEEALKILLPYYKTKKKDYDYLFLLAKASAKKGEFKVAIDSYFQAYQLEKDKKKSRVALFQSAFLSYQSKDYKEAIRKFDLFIHKYRRSGLQRDAYWLSAWSHYLEKDYVVAVDKFENILSLKKHDKRHWNQVPSDKIEYWMGMSYLKQGKLPLAAQIFHKLSEDPLHGYYSQLAVLRERSLPPVETFQREVSSISSEDGSSNQGDPNKESLDKKLSDTETSTSENEEDESEEMISQIDESDDDAGMDDDNDRDSEDNVIVPKVVFENSKKKQSFLRAQGFVKLKFNDFARWELYSIEKGNHDLNSLEHLIPLYEEDVHFFGGIREGLITV